MPTIVLTISTDQNGNVVGVGFQPAAKRGPGLPRKAQLAEAAQPKKRGRPRKQAKLELPLTTEGSAE